MIVTLRLDDYVVDLLCECGHMRSLHGPPHMSACMSPDPSDTCVKFVAMDPWLEPNAAVIFRPRLPAGDDQDQHH